MPPPMRNARSLTKLSPVTANPNAFFTQNLGRLALTSNLSTTQTRYVKPINPSTTTASA